MLRHHSGTSNTTATILLLLAAVIGANIGHVIPAVKDQRIGGGLTAERGQFPFIVSLRTKGPNDTEPTHFCGGSILSERWILTAAHCVAYGVSNTFVQVGAHHVLDDGVQHTVRRIIEHADYDLELLFNDIALIELNAPIQYNPFVQPIELETAAIGPGENATIAGWGRIEYGGSLPEELQLLHVYTLSNTDCAARFPDLEFLPKIKPNEICVYNSRTAGACNGDSGGPAVLNGRLFGLASWTLPPCVEAGVPVVYVRVREHLNWIAENMQ